LTKTTEDLLVNEIKILKEIKHENIVEMYDFQVNTKFDTCSVFFVKFSVFLVSSGMKTIFIL